MNIKEGPPIEQIKAEKAPVRQRPKPTPPKPRYKSLETEIGSLLVTGNLLAAPIVRGDMLDDLEITSLAHAIDEQAQRSPRFRKMVVRALETTGAASLLSVVVIISGRRMARHGVIDAGWDEGLKAFLAVSNMTKDTDPAQVEAVLAQMMGTPDATVTPDPEPTNGTAPLSD